MTKTARRKPASFRVEDVEIVMPPEPAPLPDVPETQAEVKDLPKLERGLRWGSIFLGALGGLISLLLSLWLYDYVLALIARDDWIGWGAVVLLGLVVVALLMIVLRELVGLFRLGRLGKIRHEADSAARQDDKPMAVDVTRRLKRFYSGREDLAWGMQRLAEHERDIMNAEELLRLSERTLVAPLDPVARSIVASSAKRVSVVTAISPNAIVDMMFVAAQNLRMLRKLATLYGARPGFFSLLKLARMVVTHIVLTGGIALGDDVIQQLVGHGLTARLSRKLGEGVFNGALTTRIGIATIDVCRPLPYLEQQRPRFRELVAEVAGLN
ncbi:MAG: TIGR01620 family protein [Methyloceanibacter sp.]|uniref:YcjF family protein n=1 Tax=Methyloceanibacter sp. TaxID=1965321 RepID=UPI001E010B01|nr:TIGR01620 family protein [Methyloceanibacter sp.]MCB1442158.1 TIGR01620 family protein [Methyloceanibacter sp.]